MVRAILKVGSMSEVVTMMLKGTARASALIQSQPREALDAILSGLEQAGARYKVGQAYELPAAAILATGTKA